MPEQARPPGAISGLARLALPIFAVATAAVAAAGLLLPRDEPRWSPTPPLFTFAVAASAWFGGVRSGLLAAALSVALTAWAAIAGGADVRVELPHVLWAASLAVVAVTVGSAQSGRRRAAQLLSERDARLRLVSEQIPAGLWSADRQLRLTSRFGGAPSLFKGPLGTSLAAFFPGEGDAHPAIAGHVRALQGEASTFELTSDGHVFQAHVEPLLNAEGENVGVIGVALDVTERHSGEQRLQDAKAEAERSRAEAERATLARDQFLAMLSHELRTPLTPAVMTVASLAERGDLPVGVREDLELARRNIELEARLIDDLLDLTRVAAGKLRLNRRPADAHDVLQDAVRVCQADARERRVKLELHLGAGRHHVLADPARLQQVFWNLLKNAIKFTPPDGRVDVRSLNPDPADPDRLVVEVSDTGVGIDADVLPRIFTAFEQGGASTTRRFGGLGLGLAISRAVIRAHGGQITAHSPGLGRGSTFSIELRAKATPSAAAGGSAPPAARVDPGAGGGTRRPLSVLLVEDDADTRYVLSRLLRGAGHSVTTADSVATARRVLTSAEGAAVELLVSDLSLPDGSGLDVVRALRELPLTPTRQPVAAIAVSGLGMADDVRASLEAGFDQHLTKPISFDVLLRALDELAAA